MQPRPIPDDYLLQHFTQAVESASAREGHVLTRGEGHVVSAYLSLPAPAAALFARLHGRVGSLFRLDKLDYVEVACPADAAQTLITHGFARPARQIPTRRLVETHTVRELQSVCGQLGLPKSGNRAAIVSRLSGHPHRAHLPGQCIEVRHQALFQRLLRVYLGDHSGDLSRVILELMGVVRFAQYAPTGGQGLFGTRADLLAYEEALRRVSEERDEEQWAQVAPELLHSLEERGPANGARRKFSSHRLYARGARRAIRSVERVHGPLAAIASYRRLVSADPENRKANSLRLALCMGRAGDARAGAELCAGARPKSLGSAEDLALDRTGCRLAKQANMPWRKLPGLNPAPLRQWHLPMVSRHPPRFASPDGPVPIEAAVVANLAQLGRVAIHGESAPWTTLFGLLFYSAFFAPVPGMLPSSRLMAPLDLRTPDFAHRRRHIIASILSEIEQGKAPDMITAAVQAHHGEAIAGVYWDLLNLRQLTQLATLIGPVSLGKIMAHFVGDPQRAWSGMPDLVILPGESGPIPAGLLFVELKSPSDSLRDNQRCWHHSLLQAGISVEVWQVGPPVPS